MAETLLWGSEIGAGVRGWCLKGIRNLMFTIWDGGCRGNRLIRMESRVDDEGPFFCICHCSSQSNPKPSKPCIRHHRLPVYWERIVDANREEVRHRPNNEKATIPSRTTGHCAFSSALCGGITCRLGYLRHCGKRTPERPCCCLQDLGARLGCTSFICTRRFRFSIAIANPTLVMKKSHQHGVETSHILYLTG